MGFVSWRYPRAEGRLLGAPFSSSLAAFFVFPGLSHSAQLPSPLPISVAEQGRCQNLSAHSHFLGGQLETHRNVYFILCGSSPGSSTGVKVVTGHRVILKDILKNIHSLKVLLSFFFFPCVYSGQKWTFCYFEVGLIIMAIQMYEWRAAWLISSN